MEEPEVSQLTRRWLEKHLYKVKPEVGVSGTEREVILDYFGYREKEEPEILWIECKGDVSLSQLLEGFIRTEFAVYYGGGHGILACPTKAIEKLMNHRDFLKQSENVICLLNVENPQLIKLNQQSDISRQTLPLRNTSAQSRLT